MHKYTVEVTLKRRMYGRKYAIGSDQITVSAGNAAEARRKAKKQFARLVFKENMLATDIIDIID